MKPTLALCGLLVLAGCATAPAASPAPAKVPTAFDGYNAIAPRAKVVAAAADKDTKARILTLDTAAFNAAVACSSSPRLNAALAAMTGQ